MNLSTASIYDNVKSPNSLSKSSVYRKINDLLLLNTDLEVRVYCPLCVKSFDFKFSLFEHLRTFHESFLTKARNQTLRFRECIFCNAKFYGQHLTAKHVLHYHSKVVKGLFVNKNTFKCCFCNMKFVKEDINNVAKHIEESHFLDFEEEFRKIFSCDTTQEMSVSEFINSSMEGGDLVNANWEDVCLKIRKHSRSKNDSATKNFTEASKINCYDFTELKQQLENIQGAANSGTTSRNKSVIKDIRNSHTFQRSARRVLRFDLPSDNMEDKENLIAYQDFSVLKQIDLDNDILLCEKRPNSLFKPNDTFFGKPQHSSTPNSKPATLLKGVKKKNSIKNYKSNFKSYITEKKTDFEFQCGKCRLLFKENFELVSHVKNNHNKLGLKGFQPCYHCAICNARFYRNHYLRKHHNLHKPYERLSCL